MTLTLRAGHHLHAAHLRIGTCCLEDDTRNLFDHCPEQTGMPSLNLCRNKPANDLVPVSRFYEWLTCDCCSI